MRIIVTSGPTREYIDAVRFISNPSTGRMGHAAAAAAAAQGHHVVLVTGPVALEAPAGVETIQVTSAAQMRDAVLKHAEEADAVIAAAAVADYAPRSPLPGKTKKHSGPPPPIELVPTPDILAQLGQAKRPGMILVGFALETLPPKEARIEAERKFNSKNLDLIILNGPAGFAAEVARFEAFDGTRWTDLGEISKHALAAVIVRGIERMKEGKAPAMDEPVPASPPGTVRLLIKRLAHSEGLELPEYKSEHASGLDLRAAVEQAMTIQPGKRALIPTGVTMAVPPGYEVQIRPRSGLALKHGVTVANTPGTIDADYRGEVCVILANIGDEPFVVERGDRVAQMVVQKVERASIVETEELPDSERGEGGFGSSGVK